MSGERVVVEKSFLKEILQEIAELKKLVRSRLCAAERSEGKK